jgi:hypothetical protein
MVVPSPETADRKVAQQEVWVMVVPSPETADRKVAQALVNEGE